MGYYARLARSLIGEPVALSARLTGDYPELSQLRLRRGGLPPRVGGWMLGRSTVVAITLRRTIFLAPQARLDADLLLHELRHVEQFRERRTFPLRYIWESLRHGYHRNCYEVDARAYAASRLEQATRIPPAEEV